MTDLPLTSQGLETTSLADERVMRLARSGARLQNIWAVLATIHRGGLGAGLAGIVLIAAERLAGEAVGLEAGAWVWGLGAGPLVLWVVWSVVRVPRVTARDAIVEMDAEMGLFDRLATAVRLSGRDVDPAFGRLISELGASAASGLRAQDGVRRPRTRGLFVGLALAGFATAGALLPRMSWGEPAAPAPAIVDEEEEAERVEAAAAIEQVAEELESVAEQAGGEEFVDARVQRTLDELRDLERELGRGGRASDEARQEAAASLEEASREIAREAAERRAEDDAWKRMAEGLSEDLDREVDSGVRGLAEALEAGDFARAAAEAERLSGSGLDDAERQRAAESLRELAERLQEPPEPEAAPSTLDDAGLDEPVREQLEDETDPEVIAEQLREEGVDEATADRLAEQVAEENRERQARERARERSRELGEALEEEADRLDDQPEPAEQEPTQPDNQSREDDQEQDEQSSESGGSDESQAPTDGQQPSGGQGNQPGPSQPGGAPQDGTQPSGSSGGDQQGGESPGESGESPPGGGDQPAGGEQGSGQDGGQDGSSPQGGQPGGSGSTPDGGSPDGANGQNPGGESPGGQPGGEGGETPGGGGSSDQPGQGGQDSGAGGAGDAAAEPNGNPSDSGVGADQGQGRQSSGASGGGQGAGRGFAEQLRELASRSPASNADELARRFRDRSEQLLEDASPEELAEARRLAEALATERSGGWDGTTELFDARSAPTGPTDSDRVIGRWFGEGAQGRGVSNEAFGERVREAAAGAERAIEEQSVPPRHTTLIRRVFERYRSRNAAPGGVSDAPDSAPVDAGEPAGESGGEAGDG